MALLHRPVGSRLAALGEAQCLRWSHLRHWASSKTGIRWQLLCGPLVEVMPYATMAFACCSVSNFCSDLHVPERPLLGPLSMRLGRRSSRFKVICHAVLPVESIANEDSDAINEAEGFGERAGANGCSRCESAQTGRKAKPAANPKHKSTSATGMGTRGAGLLLTQAKNLHVWYAMRHSVTKARPPQTPRNILTSPVQSTSNACGPAISVSTTCRAAACLHNGRAHSRRSRS